jgi:hypothetical protein
MSVVFCDSDLDGSTNLPNINPSCKDVCHFFMWHSTGTVSVIKLHPAFLGAAVLLDSRQHSDCNCCSVPWVNICQLILSVSALHIYIRCW